MMWRPRYTEEERAMRHWMRYGEYPPPPRRFRKRAWDGVEFGQAEETVPPPTPTAEPPRCNHALWFGIGLLAGWFLFGRKKEEIKRLQIPRALPRPSEWEIIPMER